MEEYLFSYGTLKLQEVQLETFGRLLIGQADVLPGYGIEMLKITDEAVVAISGKIHHPIVVYTGLPADEVQGMVFMVSVQELKQADEYEVVDYERVSVVLKSGKQAWVYIKAKVANK
jgi:gamma-glutamylcyclotransferase (GGCT)/AIG2-like uncharacterized protein YtfP